MENPNLCLLQETSPVRTSERIQSLDNFIKIILSDVESAESFNWPNEICMGSITETKEKV